MLGLGRGEVTFVRAGGGEVTYPKIILMQEDIQEDFGWKLVHGDVFRPPSNILLLSVFIGNGVQILLMTFIALGKSMVCVCVFSLCTMVQLDKGVCLVLIS